MIRGLIQLTATRIIFGVESQVTKSVEGEIGVGKSLERSDNYLRGKEEDV